MEELNSIISQVFGIKQDQIKDEYGPNNIPRWDSLSQLALISAIETHYKVTLEIEEIFQIMTIG
ncbi:MAG: acyl carrier protein, partial [Candidatus Omnitrophica bacterium]|nr:acyl carrier protein [Candidatus Omnitrophota bacterium]